MPLSPTKSYLPCSCLGAELILAASLHAIKECGERQMLFQHLHLLGPTDLLLLRPSKSEGQEGCLNPRFLREFRTLTANCLGRAE
jgi:hypothetical protein